MEMWVLLIWIGSKQTQTLAVDHFESRADCEMASNSIKQEMETAGGYVTRYDWFRCIKAGAPHEPDQP